MYNFLKKIYADLVIYKRINSKKNFHIELTTDFCIYRRPNKINKKL